MSDSKTPSDNQTSASSAPAPAAAASASPAASSASDPKAAAVAAPAAVAAAAAPAAADPKAAPAAAAPEKVITPDPNAPATGVNADEAKALADAAAAKVVTDKAASDAAAATAAEAAAGAAAPESYALDEKGLAPEIATFLKENGGLNPDLLPALTPAFKEAGLTQKQFATITSAFLGFQRTLPQLMLDRDMAAVKADPAIGGLNYARSMEEVSVALDAFADPDFKKWTVKAGIANKPEFVRVFQRIGRAMRMAGDTPSSGSPDAAPAETMAQRMYGRKKT
jgi:hypothetical protein